MKDLAELIRFIEITLPLIVLYGLIYVFLKVRESFNAWLDRCFPPRMVGVQRRSRDA